MGFEDFKKTEKIEDKGIEETEKVADETKPEEPGINRRGFLKAMAAGAGLLAGGKVVDAAEKFTGYDHTKDPKAMEEIRKTREELDYREGRSDEPEENEEKKNEPPVVEDRAAEQKPEAINSDHVVDKLEKWAESWKKDKKSEAIRKIKPLENMGPHDIAKEMLRQFSTDELKRFFPGEVFSSDYFMAQTFQESRGDKRAESSTGAKGVMQNFPASVIEAIEYLSAMRKAGLIPYHGPSKIKSRGQAKQIIEYFSENVNYGRAAGKIYTQAIFNPIYKFNTGKNKNAFRGQPVKEIQRKLLVSYHDGPSARYKNDRQLIEVAKRRAKKAKKPFKMEDSAVYYYKKVFEFMDIEKSVRQIYKNEGFKIQYEDTAVDRMLHVMERHNFSKSKLKEQTLLFIGKLEEKKKELGRDLSRGEIMDVFRPYS